MAILLKNNASAKLAAAVLATDGSITIEASKEALFPTIASPDYTYLTLEDAQHNIEIVKVTARTAGSGVMTVTRAQDGTTARAFLVGDVVELRPCKALWDDLSAGVTATANGAVTTANSAVSSVNNHIANPTGAHAATAISNTPAGNLQATTVQAALNELDAEKFAVAGGTLTGPLNEAQGTDIASAATINLNTATGNVVDVTGITAITAITLAQGAARTVRFTGTLTLTNGASLVLPGGANITTAAGDYARFRGYAGGVVRCEGYERASGVPVVGVSSFNARQGAVSLTSGDVTGALGYTPWNPAGSTPVVTDNGVGAIGSWNMAGGASLPPAVFSGYGFPAGTWRLMGYDGWWYWAGGYTRYHYIAQRIA